MQEFYKTYSNLASLLDYDGHDMSFREWNNKPLPYKCSYLFLNFYKEISIAWYKAYFSYVNEEDAVSICLQYLNKNVAKIENDPKRYTGAYIYKVAYTCMLDLHWIKRNMDKQEHETSLIFEQDGKEYDILSITTDTEEDPYSSCTVDYGCPELFDVIKDLGPKYEKMAFSLLNPEMSLRRVNKKNDNYSVNPFSNVCVKGNEAADVKQQLVKAIIDYIVRYRPDLYQEYIASNSLI